MRESKYPEGESHVISGLSPSGYFGSRSRPSAAGLTASVTDAICVICDICGCILTTCDSTHPRDLSCGCRDRHGGHARSLASSPRPRTGVAAGTNRVLRRARDSAGSGGNSVARSHPRCDGARRRRGVVDYVTDVALARLSTPHALCTPHLALRTHFALRTQHSAL